MVGSPLAGVARTILFQYRTAAVGPTMTSDALRRSGHEAKGLFRSARALDMVTRIESQYDLSAQRGKEGLRLGELGELLGRREALDRRRQHGVRIGVAIGRAIKLRQRQRGAQFEAARFLRLRNGDRGPQRLLGRRGIGRVALQQDLGADAAHLRFAPALLGALQLGKRVVQAAEPGIGLARRLLDKSNFRLLENQVSPIRATRAAQSVGVV